MLRLALHEMRTPLTAVQLNAQLIERSLTNLGLEKECRLASMVVSSARKLDALTQELGDVARLCSGTAALDVRPHDLSSLLPEIISRHAGELDVSRIRIAVPDGEPLPIALDERRLERILVNLLAIVLNQDVGRAGIDLQVNVAADKVDFVLSTRLGLSSAHPGPPSDDALGLGLRVARLLVGCLGGGLEVSQGSANDLVLLVLRFWLPQP